MSKGKISMAKIFYPKDMWDKGIKKLFHEVWSVGIAGEWNDMEIEIIRKNEMIISEYQLGWRRLHTKNDTKGVKYMVKWLKDNGFNIGKTIKLKLNKDNSIIFSQ